MAARLDRRRGLVPAGVPGAQAEAAPAPTPRPPGPPQTFGPQRPGRRNVLRMLLSAAVIVANETAGPSPSSPAAITVASPGHDPARPTGRTCSATMPATASRSATSSLTPATPTASRTPRQPPCAPLRAGPGPDLRQHDHLYRGTRPGADHRRRDPLSPATPAPLLDLVPLPPSAPLTTPPPTTSRPQRSPTTTTASAPPRTPTATAGVPAPPAASKCRCPLSTESMLLEQEAARDPNPASSIRRPAAPSGPSPPAPASRRKAGRSPTTHRQSLAALLRAAHRRRTAQRRHRGPRRQRHRPRLDPADGPPPADALARLPDGRPQPSAPCAPWIAAEDDARRPPPQPAAARPRATPQARRLAPGPPDQALRPAPRQQPLTTSATNAHPARRPSAPRRRPPKTQNSPPSPASTRQQDQTQNDPAEHQTQSEHGPRKISMPSGEPLHGIEPSTFYLPWPRPPAPAH